MWGWRGALLVLAAALMIYLLSFGLLVKQINGTFGLSGPGSSSVRSPVPIYICGSSVTMNRFGKMVYYPLIAPGQKAGWLEFYDDVDVYTGGSCLLYLVVFGYFW